MSMNVFCDDHDDIIQLKLHGYNKSAIVGPRSGVVLGRVLVTNSSRHPGARGYCKHCYTPQALVRHPNEGSIAEH